MGIDSDLIRGNVDTIILRTLTTGDKYGYEIIKEVEIKSGGTYELKQPTLYSALKRLEDQGLVSAYWVNSDIGGKRHYYKLTDKGSEFYNQSMHDWLSSRAIIDNLISGTIINSNVPDILNNKFVNLDEKVDIETKTENTENAVKEPLPFANDTETPESEVKVEDNEVLEKLNDTDALDGKDLETLLEVNEEEKVEKDILADNGVIPEETAGEEINYEAYENSSLDYPASGISVAPTDKETLNIVQEYYKTDENQVGFFAENKDSEKTIIDDDYDNEIVNDEENENSDEDNFILDLPSEKVANIEEINFDKFSIPSEKIEDLMNELNFTSDNNDCTDSNDDKSEQIDSVFHTIPFNEIGVENTINSKRENSEVFDKKDTSNSDGYISPIARNNVNENYEQVNYLDEINEEENKKVDEKINEILNNTSLSFINNNEKSNDFESEDIPNDEIEQFIPQEETENTPFDLENYFEDNENFASSVNNDDTFEAKKQILEDEIQKDSPDVSGNSSTTPFDMNLDDFNFSDLYDGNTTNEENESENFENENQKINNEINTDISDSNKSDENDNYETWNKKLNFGYGFSDLNSDENNDNNNDNYSNDFVDDEYDNTENDTNIDDKSKDLDILDSEDFEKKGLSPMQNSVETNLDVDNQRIIDRSVNYKSYSPKFTESEYRELLNNLSSFGSINLEEKNVKEENYVDYSDSNFDELEDKLSTEGIGVRQYTRPEKEPLDFKKYLLVNKIKMTSSWIVFFFMTGLLALSHVIANKLGYFNYTYLPINTLPVWAYYLLAFGFIFAFPMAYTIAFWINPTKKEISKYAPKISLLFSVLFFIQCLVVIYAVNLPFGFYSFNQIDYNHLNWLLPSVCSFMIILSSIIYSMLFKSKRFNV